MVRKERTNEQTNKQTNKQTNEQTNEQTIFFPLSCLFARYDDAQPNDMASAAHGFEWRRLRTEGSRNWTVYGSIMDSIFLQEK